MKHRTPAVRRNPAALRRQMCGCQLADPSHGLIWMAAWLLAPSVNASDRCNGVRVKQPGASVSSRDCCLEWLTIYSLPHSTRLSTLNAPSPGVVAMGSSSRLPPHRPLSCLVSLAPGHRWSLDGKAPCKPDRNTHGKHMGGTSRMALCPHMPTVCIRAWHSEARYHGMFCAIPPCQLPTR